jgi:hypothetical protein
MERIKYFENKYYIHYMNRRNEATRNHDLPAIIYPFDRYMSWGKNGYPKRNIVFPHKKNFCLYYPHIIYITGAKEYLSGYQKRMILYESGYLAGKYDGGEFCIGGK